LQRLGNAIPLAGALLFPPGKVRGRDGHRDELRHELATLGTHLARAVIRVEDVERELARNAAAPGSRIGGADEPAASLLSRRRAAERDAVTSALERSGNNRTAAARMLGVSRRTLYKKLSALGMS
jgi:DNA-binding NtrC family response regulator